jgi:hypothetical protein
LHRLWKVTSLWGLSSEFNDLDEDGVVAIGKMLQNAPALLEVNFSYHSLEASSLRQLLSGVGSENSVLEAIILPDIYFGVEGAGA